MALTNNKLRNWYCGGPSGPIKCAVKGGVHIYQGALVVIEKVVGLAKPGVIDNDLVALGVAEYEVDASAAADGVLYVHAKPGRWGGFTSAGGGDAITAADVGNTVYIVDDNTVAKTDNSGARSPAGTFLGYDDRGKLIVSIAGAI